MLDTLETFKFVHYWRSYQQYRIIIEKSVKLCSSTKINEWNQKHLMRRENVIKKKER
jgi:hypothetical protein